MLIRITYDLKKLNVFAVLFNFVDGVPEQVDSVFNLFDIYVQGSSFDGNVILEGVGVQYECRLF